MVFLQQANFRVVQHACHEIAHSDLSICLSRKCADGLRMSDSAVAGQALELCGLRLQRQFTKTADSAEDIELFNLNVHGEAINISSLSV